MTTLVVHPATGPLTGSVPVPSDKSIGHRALLLGALCEGDTRIAGFSHGEDNVSTANALRAHGRRPSTSPPRPSSSCTARGCAGSASRPRRPGLRQLGHDDAPAVRRARGAPFRATLVGRRDALAPPDDARGRPAARARRRHRRARAPDARGRDPGAARGGPAARGARARGRSSTRAPSPARRSRAPSCSRGSTPSGATRFREPSVSRDHTERMLARARRAPCAPWARSCELDPAGWDRRMPALRASPSRATSRRRRSCSSRRQLVEGSRVTARGVGVNPTRTGLLEIARDMGGRAGRRAAGRARRRARGRPPRVERPAARGAPSAARPCRAPSTRSPSPAPSPRARSGTTRIRDAEELRHKESDRIATMARRAAGVRRRVRGDAPTASTSRATRGRSSAADVESAGDHRIAMTAAVLALVGRGPEPRARRGVHRDELPEVRGHAARARRPHRRGAVTACQARRSRSGS